MILNSVDLTNYPYVLYSNLVRMKVLLGTCPWLYSSPFITLGERVNEKMPLYNPKSNPTPVRIGP